MISPPVTVWPANTFTPRRLAFESRPLRLEPRPFLCAIARLHCPVGSCRLRCPGSRRDRRRVGAGRELDRGDLDPGQVLPVAVATPVAALGLELHDSKL